MFDKFTVCESYWLYAALWGGSRRADEFSFRLDRLGFRPGPNCRLESAESDVKEGYGTLVRRWEARHVAYERLHRKHPQVFPAWPGTRNVGTLRPYHTFVESLGIDPSVLDTWV